MHNLKAMTALGSTTPQIDQFEGVKIVEIPDIALASIAMRNGKKAGFSRACKAATGVAPPPPGHFETAGDYTVFSSGLDQWMVEAPIATHEDLAAQLASMFNANASVTEQNDGWVRFDIAGALSVPMLERLCAVNSRAMKSGDVTRMAIEHLGCFVMCRQAAKKFTVLGPRSSAASLHHALINAAKSAL
ncbi:sarcosine oxidase subunit gamma [Alphaproteobacteria bacterium]|nr:sarcosine oxidase subunit gamma [Alphaproteobacteria bacterium]